MPDIWTATGTISSVVGAIGGIAAAVIAWRVFIWQRSGLRPVVTCSIEPAGKGQLIAWPAWLVIRITVRNVEDCSWQITALQFSGFRAANLARARREDGRGVSRPIEADAETALTSKLHLDIVIPPAGSPSGRYAIGGGDDRSIDIAVPLSSLRSRNVSMRLSLASTEAVQRKMTIAIKRELPADVLGARS